MGLLPLSSPYFIRVPRHFLLLSAKIQKNIGICKFIGKIVQIVETSPIYINKVVGGIDKCHFFSDNGRLLRNKAGLLPNKCHLLWKECHIVTLAAVLSPCCHPDTLKLQISSNRNKKGGHLLTQTPSTNKILCYVFETIEVRCW